MLRLSARVVRFFLGDPLLFLRYVSVGAASAALELALFSFAYEVRGWPLLAANAMALSCALVLNFTLQKQWTFRAGGHWTRRLRRYALMQAISVVLNNVLMVVMVAHWGWYAPLAKVLQIGVVFAWNFTFSKLVVFAGSAAHPPLDAQHRAAPGDALGDPGRQRDGEHHR